MKYSIGFIIIVNFFSFSLNAQHIQAPVAVQKNKELSIHSHTRIDPYFWMNKRDSKPVLDYISQENAYSKHFFDGNEKLISTFIQEFDQRIDPEESSAPVKMNGSTFQWKQEKGKEYRKLLQLTENGPVVYFDENERANKSAYYGLGDLAISTNNEILAFSEDLKGRRNYTLSFRYNKTGEILKDKIQNTDGSVIWANDNQTIFYVKKDPSTLREFQVYRHVIGSKKPDELIYEEKDERFYVYITKTKDHAFILIHSESSTSSETSLVSADKPTENPTCFLKREKDHLYEIDHHPNGFYILTNQDSPNKKLVFSESIPSKIADCTLLIHHSDQTLLEGVEIFKTFISIQSRTMGQTEIKIGTLEAKDFYAIKLPEEVYELNFFFNHDFNTRKIQYHYTSLTNPNTIFEYDLDNQQSTTVHQKKLIDPRFNSSDYTSKRVWATAKDGAKIPISLVYRNGIDLKKAPLLLYGYGSYGVTIPTSFSATRISLLDRGFVFAIAHIRGGKFLGESWYQNGKLQQKKNTFTDFIQSAEWLSKEGYCDPTSIYAQGGSAGGLLMGAVANMAPHLFKGIIAQVPFVDVVTTMLDETIPLTVGEYEEWGNPNDLESYQYMLSYSPYDNVEKKEYPAMLITTGYHDSQVQYWEPLKWIAKLRTHQTSSNMLLFDCTMNAGHGGGSGRSTERLETAKEFTFLCYLQGIRD